MSEIFSAFLSALDVSQVRNAALAGSVVPVIIGLLLFRIVAGAFARAFLIVIALVVGGFVYLQRQEITDCVDDARAGIAELDSVEAPRVSCTIFGFDIDIEP